MLRQILHDAILILLFTVTATGAAQHFKLGFIAALTLEFARKSTAKRSKGREVSFLTRRKTILATVDIGVVSPKIITEKARDGRG
jgi:hypothetical protein